MFMKRNAESLSDTLNKNFFTKHFDCSTEDKNLKN